jgi:hypothetical protein
MKTIFEQFVQLSESPFDKNLQRMLIMELAKYNRYEDFESHPINHELLEEWKALWNTMKSKDERELGVGRAQLTNAIRSAKTFFTDCQTLLTTGTKPEKPISHSSSSESFSYAFGRHLSIITVLEETFSDSTSPASRHF